jgi:hypothetical protein
LTRSLSRWRVACEEEGARMSRSPVCLSFDFGASSIPIAHGTTSPTPISRGEFGVVGADGGLKVARQIVVLRQRTETEEL